MEADRRKMGHAGRLGLLLAVLLAAGSRTDARAQDGFAWSRATLAVLDAEMADAASARTLRASGVDAVVIAVSDSIHWKESVAACREAGLRVLLDLPTPLDPTVHGEIARRAKHAGLDGVLVASPGMTPEALGLDVPGDGSFAFVLVEAADRGAEPGSSGIAALPDQASDLDDLFAHRARTPEDPSAAPVAAPYEGIDARWLLLPGPVIVPARGQDGAAWEAVAEFRRRHPALADGVHEKISDAPYAFYRGMRLDRGELDEVIVVLGAEGRIRLNVSSIFPDDVVLRDAMTGRIGLVSFGQVALKAGDGGMMLLEVVE